MLLRDDADSFEIEQFNPSSGSWQTAAVTVDKIRNSHIVSEVEAFRLAFISKRK
jgi:hypothetical protein